MNGYFIKAVLVVSLLSFAGFACAAGLTLGADDSVSSVLTAQQGKRVTIRLEGGEELTGTVAGVNGKLVQLSQLAGKEFYDAMVSLEAVSAVIIRTHE